MAKKTQPKPDDELKRLEEIKQLVIVAVFSDDVLMERLVLKGGNALDLIHRISTRASRDIDFSMQGDFKEQDLDEIKGRLESTLKQTFREAGAEVFDFRMEEVPEGLSADVADFWGGYRVEFKVVESRLFHEQHGDLASIRQHALRLGVGAGTKFSIDISKHEYVEGKEPRELQEFRIYVYSPAMIACEKLRAICQQMPEYGPIVKRGRAGSARARDFLDIYTIATQCKFDLSTPEHRELLQRMFSAKRVPLVLLTRIANYRDFHAGNFSAVKDTVKAGFTLQSFDCYFDFVLQLVSPLDFAFEAE